MSFSLQKTFHRLTLFYLLYLGLYYLRQYSFFFLILKSLILTCVPKHEPPSHLPPQRASILAWRILWTEEAGELQSMGSQSST